MAAVFREIEFHVLFGEFDGSGGRIHGMDKARAASHCVKGETSRVAKHVERVPPAGVTFEQGPVLPLVDEKSCLLSFNPVYVEAKAVLHGGEIVRLPPDVTVLWLKPRFVGQGALGFVVNGCEAIAHDFLQRPADFILIAVHAHRVELNDGHSGVIVDDQPGQVVSLAVHETVHIVVRIVGQADGDSGAISLSDTFLPEWLVDGTLVKGKYADGDTSDLVMACGQEFLGVAVNFHNVALGRLSFDLGDGPGEHPWVSSQQGFFFSGF